MNRRNECAVRLLMKVFNANMEKEQNKVDRGRNYCFDSMASPLTLLLRAVLASIFIVLSHYESVGDSVH